MAKTRRRTKRARAKAGPAPRPERQDDGAAPRPAALRQAEPRRAASTETESRRRPPTAERADALARSAAAGRGRAAGRIVARARSRSPTPLPERRERCAHNCRAVALVEEGGKALAAYMAPRQSGAIKTTVADDIGEMVRDPRPGRRILHDRSRARPRGAGGADRRSSSISGARPCNACRASRRPPVAAPDAADKRFADPEWRDNPYFDFIKQAYVLTARWADDLVKHADELDPHDARRRSSTCAR